MDALDRAIAEDEKALASKKGQPPAAKKGGSKAGVIIGGIGASGGLLQRAFSLPDATVNVLQGILFVSILLSETLHGRARTKRRVAISKAGTAAAAAVRAVTGRASGAAAHSATASAHRRRVAEWSR